MNWNIMKRAIAVMKWIENMKWSINWIEMKWDEMKWIESCSSINEMDQNIMKHAVEVMKWFEKH